MNLIGIVFVALLVLKLLKVVDISWVWVLSPLWIGGIIAIVALIIGVNLFKRF